MFQNAQKQTPRPLTPRQDKFIEEYLACGNGTRACVKAGYSSKWAHKFAPQLLGKNRQIREEIRKRQEELRATLHLSATRIVEELAAIAISDIGNVLMQEPNGMIALRDLNNLPPHVRASISQVECKTTKRGRITETQTKVQLHPKLSALDQLCKILGVTPERIQKEMAANAPETKAATLDPKTFNKEEWEAFKLLNAKRLKLLKSGGGCGP